MEILIYFVYTICETTKLYFDMWWSNASLPPWGWIYYNYGDFGEAEYVTLEEILNKPGLKLIGPGNMITVQAGASSETYLYDPRIDKYIKENFINK